MELIGVRIATAKKIYLVTIEEKLAAQRYLVERVKKNPKVEIAYKAKTKEILGDALVTGFKVDQNGKDRVIIVKGIFIEIGRIPNTEFVSGFVALDEHKHIIIDAKTQTNLPGIFAAGDCASGHEYQYVIAAGQGCMALIKAVRYVANKKGSHLDFKH